MLKKLGELVMPGKLSSFFMQFVNLKIKPVVVDHNKFLGNKVNDSVIYDKGSKGYFYSPMNISFDYMSRLMLISFENDPLFYEVELQTIHANNKEYPVVILYKNDESQEVYYTDKGILDKYKISNKKVLPNPSFYLLDDIDYRFGFTKTGLDVFLSLVDNENNIIEYKVKENKEHDEISAILAPIGASKPNPKNFPFIFLEKFGVVFKENTEIYIKINDISRKISDFPVRVHRSERYLVRFSLNPIIAYWNNEFYGTIAPIKGSSDSFVKDNNIEYNLEINDNHFEIKKISAIDELGHKLFFEFSPALPDLISLKDTIHLQGKFSTGINDRLGVLAGTYEIQRMQNKVMITINPTKGWQPFPGKLWVKSYFWTAQLEISAEQKIKLVSGWKRSTVMTSKDFSEKTSKK